MAEKKEMIIKLMKPKFYENLMLENGAEDDMIRDLKKYTTRALRQIDSHMKKDGWDLDFKFIKEDIIDELLSAHVTEYIMARVLKKGYSIHIGPKSGWVVRKKAK